MVRAFCKKNVGIRKLLTSLLTAVSHNFESPTYKNSVVCNKRQAKLIKRAKESVSGMLLELDQGVSMDVIASSCRLFVEIIEELLGQITSTDILNNIFKGFCVGK